MHASLRGPLSGPQQRRERYDRRRRPPNSPIGAAARKAPATFTPPPQKKTPRSMTGAWEARENSWQLAGNYSWQGSNSPIEPIDWQATALLPLARLSLSWA